MKFIFKSLLLVSASLVFSANANADLPGKYVMIENQCDWYGYGFNEGDVEVRISDAGRFQVGQFRRNMNQLFFDATFSFLVGQERNDCIGNCYELRDSAFVSENEFRSARTRVEVRNGHETPTFAGETRFLLVGDELAITTNDRNLIPSVRAPSASCLLRKKEN